MIWCVHVSATCAIILISFEYASISMTGILCEMAAHFLMACIWCEDFSFVFLSMVMSFLFL